jgi:hypothetical protein
MGGDVAAFWATVAALPAALADAQVCRASTPPSTSRDDGYI